MIVTPATDLLAEYGVKPEHVIAVPDARRFVPLLFGPPPWEWHWQVYLTPAESAELERDGWLLKRLFTFSFAKLPIVGFITSDSLRTGGAPIVPYDMDREVLCAETVPIMLRLMRREWERE